MDIYSDMRVPFNVAVWARSHKYDKTAVQITRALLRLKEIKAQIEALEQEADHVEAQMQTLCAEALVKQGD